MQIADVEKLIEKALGLDLKGRDSLKVVEAKFFRPAAAPEKSSNRKSWITRRLPVTARLVLRRFARY